MRKIRSLFIFLFAISLLNACNPPKPTDDDVIACIKANFDNMVYVRHVNFQYGKYMSDDVSKIYPVNVSADIEFADSSVSYTGGQNYKVGDKYSITFAEIFFQWNETNQKWDGGRLAFLKPMKKISN